MANVRLRDRSIHLKNERRKLSPRREPYWRHVTTGQFVGYRKMNSGSETWIARYTDEDNKFHQKRLGTLAEFPNWGDAVEKAQEWFKQCHTGLIRAGTVDEACRTYVLNRRVEVSDKNANDSEKRFKAHVYGTAFGRTPLDKLTTKHIENWRNTLLSKSTPMNTKRTFKVLRAALNNAFRLGEVSSDAAWRRVKLSTAGDEGKNELDFYWAVEQRRAFLEKCPVELSNFLVAISHTGARPQEIASALVDDFDRHARTLVLRHRKGYQSKLKSRVFSLSNPVAYEFFKKMARSKTPKAPLLARDNGSSWYGSNGYGAWVALLKRTRRNNNFDDRVTAYHFRHWTITDWLNAGIVAANVATIAGTSIDKIDTYYKKHVKGLVDEQLRSLETV